jgi:hypothetical protein
MWVRSSAARHPGAVLLPERLRQSSSQIAGRALDLDGCHLARYVYLVQTQVPSAVHLIEGRYTVNELHPGKVVEVAVLACD